MYFSDQIFTLIRLEGTLDCCTRGDFSEGFPLLIAEFIRMHGVDGGVRAEEATSSMTELPGRKRLKIRSRVCKRKNRTDSSIIAKLTYHAVCIRSVLCKLESRRSRAHDRSPSSTMRRGRVVELNRNTSETRTSIREKASLIEAPSLHGEGRLWISSVAQSGDAVSLSLLT